MDKTYIKVKGIWKDLYLAVAKAILADGIPGKVTMNKRGTNISAIDEINEFMKVPMITVTCNTSTTSSNKIIALWK